MIPGTHPCGVSAMTSPDLNLPLLGAPGEACPTCRSPLAGDQRYCLECGGRRGPARLDPLAHARGAADGAAAALVAPVATGGGAALGTVPALRALGQPRVVAIAAMLVLGFGVAVGAAAGPPAATGLPTGGPKIVIAAAPPPATTTPALTDTPATDTTPDTTVAASDVTATDTATAAADTPAATPAPTTPAKAPAKTPATPATPKPPAPVKHVWVVPLSQAPADVPFAAAATAPVVPDLAKQGTVLTRYASIAPGSLANRIAMISGQAPTAATLAECPTYAAVKPGTIAAKTGLVKGDGCLYPAKTVTLADQLTGAGLAWKAYFEDMGAAPPPADTSCRRPEVDQADPFALPRPGDAYLTRSDPFVYFRSITDSPDCGSNVVGLDRLAPDLAKADLTPAVSFVAPNACHDGSTVPCAAGAESGGAAAGAWLATVIPQITASPAYADGGLVVVTYDGAPATALADATAKSKGSAVGALLLSPYVAAGTQIDAAYDHYALLKTIERLFSLPALGHAADSGVPSFGAKVFANAPVAGSD